MRPFISISYASADKQTAQGLFGEMARYGFRYEALDETVSRRERETYLADAEANIVLTSSAAATSVCASDMRFLLVRERRVLCVSLEENELNDRFCSDGENTAERIDYPNGDTSDRSHVAYYIHHLYLSRLCRCAGAFSTVRCVDDAYGRLIRLAVSAYRACAGAKFDRKEEYTAAVHAINELADAYRSGETIPRLESEAATWLERGATLKDPDAMLRLAEWRLSGRTVRRDPVGALELFRQLAALGDVRGLYRLGECALDGIGMLRDPEAAEESFSRAANAGYFPARYRLGLLRREHAATKADWYNAAYELYTACTELTSHHPVGHIEYVIGKDAPAVVRPVEPRPAGQVGCSPRTGSERRAVSMRRMREDRLIHLLHPTTPTRWGTDELTHRRMQTCMARNHRRRLGSTDSRLLGAALFGREFPQAENLQNDAVWDPANAAYELGCMLENGSPPLDCPPLPLHALYWYRLAAGRGHGGAILRLAECYRLGTGVMRDGNEAVRLLRLAAHLGNAEAQFRLGVCYETGQNVRQDTKEAVRWYDEAAQKGYAPAQNNLGGCYEAGIGVRQDPLCAMDWYRRAWQAGIPEAACRLGLCYEHGNGIGRDLSQALALYEQAANAEHPYAMYRLGLCYDWGRAVPPQPSRAAELYRKAAQAGYPVAAYAIGLSARDGRGTRQDSAQAFDWFVLAASGCAQGALEAGLCLLEGRGVIRKPEQAIPYLETAAQAVSDPLLLTEPTCILPSPGSSQSPYDSDPDTFSVSHASEESDPAVLDDEGCKDAGSDLPPTARNVTEAAAEALYRLAYCSQKDGIPVVSRLEQAARLGSDKACLTLGDLYKAEKLAYEGDAADAAVYWYQQALRCPKPSASAIDALPQGENTTAVAHLRLALDCLRRADTAPDEQTDAWRCRGWKHLEKSAAGGCPEALIQMATCAFRGIGTTCDLHKAQMYLEQVRHGFEHRYDATVCLWLGDLCLYGTTTEMVEKTDSVSPNSGAALDADRCLRAAELYRDAAHAPNGADDRSRAEAMYRLAVLEAREAHIFGRTPGDSAFAWLCRAILAGHAVARQDFACMLDTSARHRETADGKRGEERQGPVVWVRQYYETHPVPIEPFRYVENSIPVTPRMDADAMYYLGECLFRGLFVPADRTAALTCYRQAAAYTPGRGEPVCNGALWSQYSLGWCLLHGAGCSADPREGVSWLNRAARYHGQAALLLAECYGRGIGVDAPDYRGALTYYRRALRLGCVQAAAGVAAMEKLLRTRG